MMAFLTNDCWLAVIKYLTIGEILCLSQVCTQLFFVCRSNYLWKNITQNCRLFLGRKLLHEKRKRNWHECFKREVAKGSLGNIYCVSLFESRVSFLSITRHIKCHQQYLVEQDAYWIAQPTQKNYSLCVRRCNPLMKHAIRKKPFIDEITSLLRQLRYQFHCLWVTTNICQKLHLQNWQLNWNAIHNVLLNEENKHFIFFIAHLNPVTKKPQIHPLCSQMLVYTLFQLIPNDVVLYGNDFDTCFLCNPQKYKMTTIT